MSTLAQGHANLLCLVPNTLTETRQSKKETTKIQRCSEPRVQQMSTAVDQTVTIPRTRESSRDPGEQHTVTRKNVCSRQKLPTTCNVRCTQARHEKQRSTKTKKNTVNVKYSRVATFVRFQTKDVVEVQRQNRDLLIRDVCTCLACPKTFPRSLTTLKRHVDVIRISYA